jgi:transketolase
MAGALDERSLMLRRRITGMLAHARRGHVGSAFSLVEILRVLFDDMLRFDPARPEWPDRDRFILSKGHGCLALYVMLADKGIIPESELAAFSAFNGMLGGHPDARKIPGVETSTGSLGHGPAFGAGMALHARMQGRDHRVFIVTGDGECDEGSVWEAALIAGKHRLDNYTILVDYNKLQSYGPVAEVQDLEPFAEKWRAFGFGAAEVDGHDVKALRNVLTGLPVSPGKPTAIICHTVKGKGLPFAEQNPAWHHKNRMTDAEIEAMYAALEAS